MVAMYLLMPLNVLRGAYRANSIFGMNRFTFAASAKDEGDR